MDFRRARESDLPRLVELWMDMMAEHGRFEPRVRLAPAASYAYESYLMLHLRSPKSLVFAATEGGVAEAFCCAYVCQNLPMFLPAQFGYLSDLFVAPAWRRQGVGRRLFREACAFCRAHGVGGMQLQVYHRNGPGRAFWDALGFEPFFGRMALDLGEEG